MNNNMRAMWLTVITFVVVFSQGKCDRLDDPPTQNGSLNSTVGRNEMLRTFGLLNLLFNAQKPADLLNTVRTACRTALGTTPTVKLNTGTYFFSPTTVANWQAAENECSARGMLLVAIETQQEETAIENQITALINAGTAAAGDLFWISLTDLALDTNFVWSSTGKQRTFGAANNVAPWSATFPNLANGNCVRIAAATATTFNWQDLACATAAKFICELSPVCKLLI